LDRALLSRGLYLAAPLLHRLTPAQLRRACRLVAPALPLVQALGTPIGVLSLEGLDERGRLVAEIEVRARREGLNVPALPSVWAARRLLGPEPPAPGVLRMEQLFAPAEVAAWLRQEGYAVAGVGSAPVP
jgi:hypothetical protein